jgi:glutamyl-tRNA reductase
MIGIVGISYKSAPVEIREQFTFLKEDIREFSDLLMKDENFKSLVILSTCNRTEIYFYTQNTKDSEGFVNILDTLSKYKGYSNHLKDYFYFKSGNKAVEHLFKVVSGIDSLIIGEDQIIGQVKSLFAQAQELGITDGIIERLFNKAFEAGKKVRSETEINRGSGSVSSAAVDLCNKYYPDLSKASVLVIGAGQTGQLVLTSLSKKNLGKLFIANRTLSKAQELAERYSGKALSLDKIAGTLPESDIVIVATDAKKYLVSSEMLNSAALKNKKQLFIDLSVPRNIDEQIARLESKKLFAVDDLSEIVNETTRRRKNEIAKAEIIINKITEEYMEWLVMRGLAPVFSKIKDNMRQIHEDELRGFAKINNIDNQELLENYGKHISDKYSRIFIKNLRKVFKNGQKKEYMEAINELFEF